MLIAQGFEVGGHVHGATGALPLVEMPAAALAFRPWGLGMRMARGRWNIPVPPPEAERVVPQVGLGPLVGRDGDGYGLGYGGGRFDRTPAALGPRPLAVGVGPQSARLGTIAPQPHDGRLPAIVAEAGVQLDGTAAR